MALHKCNKENEITEIKIDIATIKNDIGYIKDCIQDEKQQRDKDVNSQVTTDTNLINALSQLKDYQTKQKAIIGAVITVFAAFGSIIIWLITKVWGK